MPTYRELPETPLSNPELAKEYPIRLSVAGRFNPMYHSEYRVPGCGTRSMWPDPIVQIHATDARDLGIRDGDWVWIETLRGRIRQRAKLEWGITRGVAIAQMSCAVPRTARRRAVEPGRVRVQRQRAHRRRLRNT